MHGAIDVFIEMFRLGAPRGRKGALRKEQPPVADVAAGLLQSDGGAAEPRERLVHTGVEVGQRVEHGAVQVEQNGF